MTYYAVAVAPQKERTTRAIFRRRGQSCYLPAKVIKKRLTRRAAKRAVVPLFPGYLFVEAPHQTLIPLWMHMIKDTRGVLGFVSVTNDGNPSPIAEAKIERLKQAIADDLVEMAKRKDGAKLKKGREARFRSGPLAGKSGSITWMRGDKARIFGWLFGSPREITVNVKDLEAA